MAGQEFGDLVKTLELASKSWQVQRSACNLRWFQLGDAISAGQFNLLRKWQMVFRVDELINGK